MESVSGLKSISASGFAEGMIAPTAHMTGQYFGIFARTGQSFFISPAPGTFASVPPNFFTPQPTARSTDIAHTQSEAIVPSPSSTALSLTHFAAKEI